MPSRKTAGTGEHNSANEFTINKNHMDIVPPGYFHRYI